MTGNIVELLIIAVIILGIGVAIWKGGSANPESTGTLGKQVSGLSTKVSNLSTRVGHVEQELEELKSEAATAKDIERVEALAERTFRSVDRIERMLIEKGLGK